jgi:hypothetical protein
MNLLVSGEYTRANQFPSVVQSYMPRLFSPGVGAQVVTAQQDAVPGKSTLLRRGVNKLGELRWSLSGVTAQLIYLAGSGFDVQD